MNNLKSISNRIVSCIAQVAVEGHLYKEDWGDEYRAKKIDETINNLENNPALTMTADMINSASRIELNEIGFSCWSTEPNKENKVLMLIPITLKPYIDKDLDVYSINQEDNDNPKSVKFGIVDDDHRMGFLAFGVLVDATVTDKEVE